MNYYQRRKAAIVEEAIEWQTKALEECLSYDELAEAADYFYPLAKRYGLLTEFRENAIPC